MTITRSSSTVILALALVAGCQPEPQERVSYERFDQTPSAGWRALADDGRYREAARSIVMYRTGEPDLEGWQIRNLLFHEGQLYAFVGERNLAVSRFRQSLHPAEPPDSPIKWNAYVRATIAFLEIDRETLDRMRTEVARGKPIDGSDGDVPNLAVVDRLIANFGKTYAEAYGVGGAE